MTVKQLEKIAAEKADLINVRRIVREQAEKLAANTGYRKQVLVCGGTGCTSSSSMLVIEALEKELKEKIEFCSLLIKYGNLVGASSEQSIKAFKLKDNFEEELRVLKLKMGK